MPYFERFVSRRYLFTREKNALVSVITFIAILGVAVGVAALVLTLGVMDGAEKDLFGKVIAIYPHVSIRHAAPGEEIARADKLVEIARKQPGVLLAEAVIEKETLLSTPLAATGELVAARLTAVESAGSALFHLRNADPDGPPLAAGPNEVLLGKPLAEKLGVKAGEAVLAVTGLTSNRTNRQSSGKMFKIAGVFDTGYYAFDSTAAIVSMATAREALAPGNGADYIHIKLEEPFAAQVAQQALAEDLGLGYRVSTWIEENGGFFQMLTIQKFALYLILMLIILVAGFNIIGTLILMVIEKTREIGIMKAMGASGGSLRRTFLYAGAWIGFLGTSLGVSLGLLGCYLLKNVVHFEMPPSVYNFDHLPVLVKPMTVGIIVVSAMAVCLIAAFFPAWQAARLDPVEALRHE